MNSSISWQFTSLRHLLENCLVTSDLFPFYQIPSQDAFMEPNMPQDLVPALDPWSVGQALKSP